MGAEQRGARVAGLGEQAGDFVRVMAGVRQAVADDEQSQGAIGAGRGGRHAQDRPGGFPAAVARVAHLDLEGMLAGLAGFRQHAPAAGVGAAERAADAKVQGRAVLREHQVVEVDLEGQAGDRVQDRWQGQAQGFGSRQGWGEQDTAEQEAQDHGGGLRGSSRRARVWRAGRWRLRRRSVRRPDQRSAACRGWRRWPPSGRWWRRAGRLRPGRRSVRG